MSAFLNTAYETTLYVADSGMPVTDLAPADVSLKTRKYGEVALTTLSELTSAMWSELGNGFYILKLPASYFDTLGRFFFLLSGSSFPSIVTEIDVLPTPLPSVRPGRCVVTGTITDLTGEPVVLGPRIVFRLADAPVAIDGVFVQGGFYETRPDAYGNFSVSMIQGVRVVVEIELLGIKHVITVPDQETARLIDLLPSLP